MLCCGGMASPQSCQLTGCPDCSDKIVGTRACCLFGLLSVLLWRQKQNTNQTQEMCSYHRIDPHRSEGTAWLLALLSTFPCVKCAAFSLSSRARSSSFVCRMIYEDIGVYCPLLNFVLIGWKIQTSPTSCKIDHKPQTAASINSRPFITLTLHPLPHNTSRRQKQRRYSARHTRTPHTHTFFTSRDAASAHSCMQRAKSQVFYNKKNNNTMLNESAQRKLTWNAMYRDESDRDAITRRHSPVSPRVLTLVRVRAG